jgi:hypothetical protein
LDGLTRFQHGWQKRLEIGQTIRHRRYDHHTDVVTSQVLLILKILIGREEDVELSGSDSKQPSIRQPGPAAVEHGLCRDAG